MDVHWQCKKQRSGGMSNPKINEWYDLAIAAARSAASRSVRAAAAPNVYPADQQLAAQSGRPD